MIPVVMYSSANVFNPIFKEKFMKKRISRFTLVEMLTVVAIIGILAGLIIPTVIIAQNRGRETQAKSDISSIMTALKQLKSDYNRVLVRDGSNYYAGGVQVPSANIQDFVCSICPSSLPPAQRRHNVVRLTANTNYESNGNPGPYDALIAELSAPKNSVLTGLSAANQRRCINRRRKVYLDPKNGFAPTANYDSGANREKLWRDPWGNPYVIYVGVDADHLMAMPNTNTQQIASGLAVYSFGPNGTDDGGCNASLDACISSITGNGSGNHKNHDDIASWNL